MKKTMIALAAALFALPIAVNAQTPNQYHQPIQHRKAEQQQRIGNGMRSGELTHRETAHLERQEHAINREERNMRAQNNGRLTTRDRRTIQGQQNAESRRIYRDKHNDRIR